MCGKRNCSEIDNEVGQRSQQRSWMRTWKSHITDNIRSYYTVSNGNTKISEVTRQGRKQRTDHYAMKVKSINTTFLSRLWSSSIIQSLLHIRLADARLVPVQWKVYTCHVVSASGITATASYHVTHVGSLPQHWSWVCLESSARQRLLRGALKGKHGKWSHGALSQIAALNPIS